jgi:uncharacterized membrane-anchored protein
MSAKRLIAAAFAVALLQIGFLGWMIAGRAAILRDGREIVLKVEPVDPRDLLRGDYVRLTYEISRIPAKLVTNAPADGTTRDQQTIVVRLTKGDDGTWHPQMAWLGSPPQPAGPDAVDIAGTIKAGSSLGDSDATLWPDYGIERFYLPEGEGKAIEKDIRTRPFQVKIAVSSSGQAQIKALMDGAATLFDEPLY